MTRQLDVRRGRLSARRYGCAPSRSKLTAVADWCVAADLGACTGEAPTQGGLRSTQAAGYDPDVSKGVRRLNINVGDSDESDDEAPPAKADASAAPPNDAAATKPAPEPEAQAEAPAPRRYGVVMREVADGAVPAAAAAPPALPSTSAAHASAEVPAVEVLRRVFTRDHPGVAAMAGWLEEEGVHSAAHLGAVLAGRGGAKGGAAALRDIGFRPEWAAATAAGFERAAAAAEKAARNS